MKGSEQRLVEYMDGAKKRFVIPVYQRNYDWKMENCKQLFDDLVKIIRSGRKSHFFGSIVSVYNPDGRNSEYLIIDGQQRLTTVYVLLSILKDFSARQGQTMLSDEITETLLINKYKQGGDHYKFMPTQVDRKAFKIK